MAISSAGAIITVALAAAAIAWFTIARDGMVWIPGGEFSMRAAEPSDPQDGVGLQATRDSRPVHRVSVDGFWMDRTEVTDDQFAAFVAATGYVTVAERTPGPEDFPGAPPDLLVAGSLVFSRPDLAVPLDDERRWWTFAKGANWRHPFSAGSTTAGKGRYPVVHVGYEDAAAYARWAGKRVLRHPTIRTSLASPSVCTAAGRFCAPISTARDTWSARAGKGRSRQERITSVSERCSTLRRGNRSRPRH